MVVFICGSCNDSLKKNAIKLHLSRCRCEFVSCCDCGKDFNGDSYKSHTECVSEDVKYGPQDQAGGPAPQDKGKRKQQEWFKSIKEASEKANLSGPAEMALNKLLEFPNIPRKKSKFINFAEHCCRINRDIVDQIWAIFDTAIRATAEVKCGSKSDGEQTQDDEAAQKTVDSGNGSSYKLKRELDSSEPEVEMVLESGQNVEVNKDSDTQEKENDADQGNESSLKPKKSKKKKRQREQDETRDPNSDNNQDQKEGENVRTEKEPETMKKKKKSHVILEDVSEENKVTNSNEQASAISSNEHESVEEEKVEHNESNNVGQQIGWFKKLKRQIKESETVDQKKFKKIIKRLKKEYNLTESHPDLIAKARVKLMKRHNYTITDGEITYKRLF